MTSRGTPGASVLIAASEPIFGTGIASTLRARSFAVTVVETVARAVEALEAVRPNVSVLVLDPPFPDSGPAGVCASLIAPYEGTMAVVVLRRGDREAVHTACRFGARGLFDSSVDPNKLADALLRLAAGEIVVDPALVPNVVEAHAINWTQPAPGLSESELAALRLVAEGRTSKEIAHILRTTASAVDHALERAAGRLNATHRAHAVAEALRRGLLK